MDNFGFNITGFDFTANELSRQFEPYVTSTKRFSDHFKTILARKKDAAEKDASNDLDELPLIETTHELPTIQTETTRDLAKELPGDNGGEEDEVTACFTLNDLFKRRFQK